MFFTATDDQYRHLRLESPISSFLSRHDTGAGIVLSHLDKTRLRVRWRAFLQSCAVHTFFFSIFLWRLFHFYTNYGSPSKLYSYLSLFGFLRMGTQLVILYITGPPPLEFACSTFWYRLRYGFRPTEIVIRQPIASQLKHISKLPVADADVFINDQILRAMDINLLQITPGDITDLNFWRIDYRACEEAHKLARAKGPTLIEMDAWRSSVWSRSGEGRTARWKVFEDWQMHDPARRDRRQELFKEKLIAMGKGHLYDKWRDMVLSNTTTPGGATRSISMNLVKEHAAFFESEGIDFLPIGEEINGQITAEFNSSAELPIGF